MFEERIGVLLNTLQCTLATAESLTGGMVGHGSHLFLGRQTTTSGASSPMLQALKIPFWVSAPMFFRTRVQ